MTTTSSQTATAARATTDRTSPAHTSTDVPATAGPLRAMSVSAVTVSPQVSWLSATGKLVGEDAATRLANVLASQREIGCRFVWLDISQVPIVDRSSLDVLVEAHRWFRATGGTLVLTGVSPRIARLLEVTESDQALFAIVPEPDPHPRPIRHEEPESQPQRDESADQETQTTNLTVGARRVIDRAVGVVMGRTHCGVAEATDQLLVLSRATGRSPHQVAQSILDDAAKVRARTAHAYRTRTDVGRPARRTTGARQRSLAINLNARPGPERSGHVYIG